MGRDRRRDDKTLVHSPNGGRMRQLTFTSFHPFPYRFGGRDGMKEPMFTSRNKGRDEIPIVHRPVPQYNITLM